MGQRVKTFPDGSFLEYDYGSFDSWCVYFTNAAGVRGSPKDMDYFFQLKQLAAHYGPEQVYQDYVRVYDITGTGVRRSDLEKISQLAARYGRNAFPVDVLFTTLYMTMIAEERKANTKLGKRIKRLGIHQLLMEGKSVSEAANFMRGMGWQTISRLCEERGF